MNDPIPDDKLDALKQLIFQRQKIEAIKLYRKTAGVDLAQAKSAIEAMEKELREAAPEKFSASKDRRGCLGVLLLCFGPGVIIFTGVFCLIRSKI